MDRVSSTSGYQSSLLNIMNAASAQNVAQQQIDTGKLADDLTGYAPPISPMGRNCPTS
jgi:hypothetical protein